MLNNKAYNYYFSLGDAEGRRLYHECLPLDAAVEKAVKEYGMDEFDAYTDGLQAGYDDEKNNDCTTNFIDNE